MLFTTLLFLPLERPISECRIGKQSSFWERTNATHTCKYILWGKK